MWLEITDKVIDLPGIFIFRNNPSSIGAYSILKSENNFVLWVHEKRHTAELLREFVIGEKCTFTLIHDKRVIIYCGSISGRDENKLGKITVETEGNYTYPSSAEYLMFLSISSVTLINHYYLVICNIDKTYNHRIKEWLQI